MEQIDQNHQNSTAGMNQELSTQSQFTEAANAEDVRRVQPNTKSRTGWGFAEKIRLVELYKEERNKGAGFMKRLKKRWDQESNRLISAQNLYDNAKRFEKDPQLNELVERRRKGDEPNRQVVAGTDGEDTQDRAFTWNTDMKVRLCEIDIEERKKGKGFMRRMKSRWDAEFPDFSSASEQKLRDNAARLKRQKEIMNLVLVRKRHEETIEQDGSMHEQQGEMMDVQERFSNQTTSESESQDNEDEIRELSQQDKILEAIFLEEVEKLQPTSLDSIETRERLLKVRMSRELEQSANNVLGFYSNNVMDIGRLTDMVYAMGRATARALGVTPKEKKRVIKGGNRRERKLRREIKTLRQCIARTSNEIHRRKVNRKQTKKEKRILKELSANLEEGKTSTSNLRKAKEEWLDELRYKKVKLCKLVTKGKRIRNNAMFMENESGLYKKCGASKDNVKGTVPDMEDHVSFWGEIWEQEKLTPEQPWMKEVERKLKEKIWNIQDFTVKLEDVREVIKKRKNWTAPGSDGIQNYWWKKFTSTWRPLCRVMNNWKLNRSSIPKWLPEGRTVLLPKTNDLSSVRDYRPITCLNTSYKIYTGLIGNYMKAHAITNNIWDEAQLGTMESVLGTVDHLLVDNCIMDEVREHQRNMAVAFYDYQKAYDKVHHDWMLKVYEWIGIPEDVCLVIKSLMEKWRTRLQVSSNTSRWININCGFLQGDSYSPVGYCLSEIPICLLLSETRGYKMGEPGKRNIKKTHSLFIDDLKVYQENHEQLRCANELIVKASSDTGACYGVKKCAEMVFKKGKMVKGEGLDILEERMKALDPDKNEWYKFLGIEQSGKINKETVMSRITSEMKKRLESLAELELYDKNLMRAINSRVIPVAAYAMNVCKFTKTELKELDMTIKRVLRTKNMLGTHSSDERLYMSRQEGGRGLKSFRDVYTKTKARVACYMALSDNEWLKVAWSRECKDEYCSIKREAEESLRFVGVEAEFQGPTVKVNGEEYVGSWKKCWTKIKGIIKNGIATARKNKYLKKKMQSKIYSEQDIECSTWLTSNLDPRKTAAIINVQEQMVETRCWKSLRGIEVATEMCRLCGSQKETVHHLLAGCKVLAGKEYTYRHNKALMVFAVAWAKEGGLLPESTVWYKETLERGDTLEGNGKKMMWDFEYKLRKYEIARRPDLTLEDTKERRIWLVDLACPQEDNIQAKEMEKRKKYQQLSFEIRERRPGYHVEVLPLIIGSLGGGVKRLELQIKKVIKDRNMARTITREIQKTVLMESETIIRKVISNIIQPAD